jgi:taurine dioxygenase
MSSRSASASDDERTQARGAECTAGAAEVRARRLAATFAAEVDAGDLAQPLAPAALAAVRAHWLESGVAVFRGQTLDDHALVGFARQFGPLFVHVRSQFHSLDSPAVMMISNVDVPGRDYGTLGRGELGWHTDQAYTRRPAFGTLLHAIEIPANGGETEFADLIAAFEAMPAGLRARVEGRRIVYSIDASVTSQGIAATEEQRQRAPVVSHPIVRQHPLQPRRALYVSPDHAVSVEGLGDAESRALLAELAEWITQPRFCYTHHWRVGDLVMWDNTRVVHRRAAFPDGQRRVLKRTGFMLPDEIGVPQ